VDRPTSRHISFDACFNFRDLGGYRTGEGRFVRWQRLYRSDALHRLSEQDVETFAAMGLRTVIDLRSKTEVDDHGRAPDAPDRDWHHVPMLDDIKLAPTDPAEEPLELREPMAPGEGYLLMAENFAPSIAQVFELLSEESRYPAVFHCTAGKDRTGVLAALILEVLGVADETIAEDYGLTELARERTMAWITVHEPDYAAYLDQIPVEFRIATPEKMLGLLERLRAKYGSVPEFLAAIGVPLPRLDRLRDLLLEA
jgi:protein-tyrosine phosphatase